MKPLLEKPKKKPLIRLKVVDFSILNGIKFGIGFTIGSVLGTFILTISLAGLAMFTAFVLKMPINLP